MEIKLKVKLSMRANLGKTINNEEGLNNLI